MKSVLEVINATTAYFQKSGVGSARLNIEQIGRYARACQRCRDVLGALQ